MPDPGVPEWAERAAQRMIREELVLADDTYGDASAEVALVITEAIGSESLRKLERYPEMVKALRACVHRRRKDRAGFDPTLADAEVMDEEFGNYIKRADTAARAALAGEPEDGA